MKETTEYIFFYGFEDHFSNFYKSNFIVDNIRFSCGEQYIMYNKAILFNDHEIANLILAEYNPKKIKMLGRKVKHFNEKKWDDNKYEITYKGLYEKYNQNYDLYNFILDTECLEIVEASPTDIIWGIGINIDNPNIENKKIWRGNNLLGKILMDVRSQLIYEYIELL
jgi:ribA/ribD-fused uncharacterized protein